MRAFKKRAEMTTWSFMAFISGLLAVAALPGFAYFYFIRDTQFHVAVVVGVVLGGFLLVAIDPVIMAMACVSRAFRAFIGRKNSKQGDVAH